MGARYSPNDRLFGGALSFEGAVFQFYIATNIREFVSMNYFLTFMAQLVWGPIGQTGTGMTTRGVTIGISLTPWTS